MTEIEIDAKLTGALAGLKKDIGSCQLWIKHGCCIPSNSKGLYGVYENISDPAKFVSENYIPDYPYILINSIAIEISRFDSFYEKIDYEYSGPDNSGVALVGIDISRTYAEGKSLVLVPSLLCRYKDKVHAIYRLKDFLPGDGIATQYSINIFGLVVGYLMDAIGGFYLCSDDPILNPFSNKVEVIFESDNKFTFKDFRDLHRPSKEELEKKRKEGKRKQAEAGRQTALKRSNESIRKICDAIEVIKKRAKGKITKSEVARIAELDRKTVMRRWDAPEIQKML